MDDDIEQEINILKALLKNLKKKPKVREYLEDTRLQKLKSAEQSLNNIKTLIYSSDISIENKELYIETTKQLYFKIQKLLIEEQNFEKQPSIFITTYVIIFIVKLKRKRRIKMATEIIKIATSLIPQYDGNGDKLNNVIAALTALKVVVTPPTEPLAIQIILSKLEKKARSAIGEAPVSIDEIIDKLKQNCKQHISSDIILAKLNATRQNGVLNKFTTEIEELTNQLETAYINDKIPNDTATKMANKAGIKALGNGLKNSGTQLIIRSGTFNNINEAVGRVMENDNESTQTASMLYYRDNKHKYKFNNHTNQNRNQPQRRFPNQVYRHRNSSWRQGNNFNRQNSFNWNNNQSNNNYRNNQRRQYNHNEHRNESRRGRVFHATSEQNNTERHNDHRPNHHPETQQNDFLERRDRLDRSSQ